MLLHQEDGPRATARREFMLKGKIGYKLYPVKNLLCVGRFYVNVNCQNDVKTLIGIWWTQNDMTLCGNCGGKPARDRSLLHKKRIKPSLIVSIVTKMFSDLPFCKVQIMFIGPSLLF